MTLTASSSFNVASQTPVSESTTVVIGPPVATSTGRGRLIHPSLGTYDYALTPNFVRNCLGDILAPPVWAHAATLGGGVDVLWPGFARDPIVEETWHLGDGSSEAGSPIDHFNTLWAMFANPPDPAAGQFVLWYPNYVSAHGYQVALAGLRAGQSDVTADVRLLGYGYISSPVVLQLRIIGYAP